MPERDFAGRALVWAQRRPQRWGRRNPWVVAVQTVRNAVEDRVGGLAAEMAFWALLSFVPLIVSIAALLGYAERLVGVERMRSGQEAIVAAGSVVFSAEVTAEVVRPFAEGLLRDGRGGVAATSLLVALYLASRVFTATIRALDLAYRVPERRGLVRQRLISIGFAAGLVGIVVASLLLAVLGPLVGSRRLVADGAVGGAQLELVWSLARWPILLVLMGLFLAAVYHWGPNMPTTFREGLPGAVVAVLSWTLASVGLRLYLAAGGADSPGLTSEDEAIAFVARVVGSVVALLLWTYVTGVAVLLGGELNAELARQDAPSARGVQPASPSETMPSHRGGGAQGG